MHKPRFPVPPRRTAAFLGVCLLAGCASTQPRRPALAVTGPADPVPPVVAIGSRQIPAIEPIELQTDRYSYISARPAPDQINPLLTVIDVRIPRDILTVEQAAEYLLQRSGYHVNSTEANNASAHVLLVQVIPEVHRHLGPMTLQDALITLGGQAFRLLVDPVNRMVAYDLDPGFASAGGKP